ncbi:hypothetical protein [Nonomuraea sp. B1E8]|uniref:hypothetical protein n=1 Tax=unclassified Nonomuraea TaxID=2593643 RepID=UPI00325C9B3C
MKKAVKAMVATAAVVGTLSGGTAQAAALDASSQARAQSPYRTSLACKAPKKAKSNYSWGDGRSSVTVYFNNHCSHKMYAKLHIKNSIGGNFKKCLATNGGTKGKKKFHIGLASTLTRITLGCG